MTSMRSPNHERVVLRPTERAEFMAIVQRFGPEPKDPTNRSALGWVHRIRVLLFSHLYLNALLLPVGVAALIASVLVWWPLGLVAAALVIVGQIATFELVRARYLRRRLRATPSTKGTKPC